MRGVYERHREREQDIFVQTACLTSVLPCNCKKDCKSVIGPETLRNLANVTNVRSSVNELFATKPNHVHKRCVSNATKGLSCCPPCAEQIGSIPNKLFWVKAVKVFSMVGVVAGIALKALF